MARVKLIWTTEAEQDLQRIRQRIAKDSARAATAFANRIKRAVRRLRSFPELGAVVEERDNPELREILVGAYRVFYRWRKPDLRILMIFHSARSLTTEDYFLTDD
jgi:plasmid stabilization system protein ParE